uniref:Uncharacterized protein n=2 Tax=Chrysotila carterae TaxID=13221 RepID=A0A6S9Y9J7_CHRCT
MALLFNVVASLAVVVGVCATNAAERMANEEFGYIAAFAAGIYVHVATWDSLPRVYTLVHTPLLRAACLLCFIIGVVAVASLLADYDECGPIDGNVIPPAFQQILDQILGTQQQQQQQQP